MSARARWVSIILGLLGLVLALHAVLLAYALSDPPIIVGQRVRERAVAAGEAPPLPIEAEGSTGAAQEPAREGSQP